jgi:hypothetical protein
MVFEHRNRLVSFRVSEEEYNKLRNSCASGSARSVSDLARIAVRLLIGLSKGRGESAPIASGDGSEQACSSGIGFVLSNRRRRSVSFRISDSEYKVLCSSCEHSIQSISEFARTAVTLMTMPIDNREDYRSAGSRLSERVRDLEYKVQQIELQLDEPARRAIAQKASQAGSSNCGTGQDLHP